MNKTGIVTKDSLRDMIAADPIKVIGRALVAIFNNQTSEEQSGMFTKFLNGKGFTQGDGRIGALGAKYYLAHGRLEDWQLKIWQTCGKQGYPRICKYAKQLNAIAVKRRALKAQLFAYVYGGMGPFQKEVYDAAAIALSEQSASRAIMSSVYTK